MAYKHIGKNFTPPDVRAKVTGKAKYSEDFRAEGMLFIKLLTSPMPNARVRNIDSSAALKMEGVVDILTAEDVPAMPVPQTQILTNNPKFVGDPILAIAAVDETTASNALEVINIEYEPLPFVIDPLQSLYPGGVDAHDDGNVTQRMQPTQRIKWTARDFAAVGEDELPRGEPRDQWEYGDVDAGFENAAVVLDETFVVAGHSHHSMEPRSSFAYWENGKCYLHASSQSHTFNVPGFAAYVGIEPENLILIAEYCGGGFGSKGSAYPIASLSAHMSKKTGRPCMLRITRAEEYYLGSRRNGFQGNVKLAFREDGKLIAADMYVVQQSGANDGFPDYMNAGGALSLVYTPEAMRWKGIPVATNTPITGAQRGPGQNQLACVMEPLMDKAAKELGVDRLVIREINATNNDSKYADKRIPVSSAYLREAIRNGAERFNWEEKKKQSGQRNGTKVTGIGVGQAFHPAGATGFDGLVSITPDGKVHVHTGVGNLGTYSYASTSRISAEVLGCSWENVVIERGDSRRNLPWNLGQFGSNTSFTMTRTNYVGAMDAKMKLLEIAAMDLGGISEDYDVGDDKVFSKADPTQNLTLAQAAQRAIELGGKYDGHKMNEDMHAITKASVTALAGTALVGAAKDTLPSEGMAVALASAFMKIELDTETGKYEILEYVGTADCGTVVHPQGLEHQIRGGGVMGIGMAGLERIVYDPQNGLPANVGFYQSKPPSYLDVPAEMDVGYVDNKPDPSNPVGARGIGEPLLGCAASALLSAISDALGGVYFNRTPVVPDMIINALADRPQSYKTLQMSNQ